MLAVALLRRRAYNIRAVHRAVTLRVEKSHRTLWHRLFVLLKDALVTATSRSSTAFARGAP